MKTTMDAAGRILVPKILREQARLVPGTPVEMRYRGGIIEIEPTALPVTVARQGRFFVAVPETSVVVPLTDACVRETRRRMRRDRGAE